MNLRQRIIMLTVVCLILVGNTINVYINRQQAVRYFGVSQTVEASSPNEELALLAEITALDAEGKEHNLEECKLLHINWATLEQLQKLPGVGPVLAKRMIDTREEKLFYKFEDLLLVSGIGEKKLLQIKPLVCLAIPDVED